MRLHQQGAREAAKWYRLAAEQGNARAQYNLAATQGNTDAENNRDLVAEAMTREQIAEAQRLAREWQPKAE